MIKQIKRTYDRYCDLLEEKSLDTDFWTMPNLPSAELRCVWYIRNFKYYDARKELDKAIAENPSNLDLLLIRCELFLEISRYDLMLEDVKKVFELDPNNWEAYLYYSLYFFKGLYDAENALKNVELAISLAGNIYDLIIYQAIYLHELGRLLEELECYNAILKDRDKDYNATLNKAELFCDLGDFETSIRLINELMCKEPNDWLLNYYRAKVYIRSSEFKKAELDIHKIKRKYLQGYLNCLLLKKKGDLNNAIKCLRGILRPGELENYGYYELGEMYLSNGQIRRARILFTNLADIGNIDAVKILKKLGIRSKSGKAKWEYIKELYYKRGCRSLRKDDIYGALSCFDNILAMCKDDEKTLEKKRVAELSNKYHEEYFNEDDMYDCDLWGFEKYEDEFRKDEKRWKIK